MGDTARAAAPPVRTQLDLTVPQSHAAFPRPRPPVKRPTATAARAAQPATAQLVLQLARARIASQPKPQDHQNATPCTQ